VRVLISKTVDVWEFSRFVVSGLLATLGNFAAVFLARRFLPFDVALFAGILAGVTISFAMSKLFAFKSASWRGAGGEVTRFLLVYAMGCALYWLMAVAARALISSRGFGETIAEPAAVVVGAGAMMFTTYFGHRFYTYKSHLRVDGRLARSSSMRRGHS
jgi:putative flippase GtrA